MHLTIIFVEDAFFACIVLTEMKQFRCIKRGQFDSNSLYIRLEKLFTQVYNDRLNLFIFPY